MANKMIYFSHDLQKYMRTVELSQKNWILSLSGKKIALIPISVLGIILLLSLFFPSVPSALVNQPGISLADTAWMLTATALVLIMTPGLAFFYGGMVNKKNVISTMLQSFIS